MIKIAHRGNTDGKRSELENTPEYLLEAIEQGYEVELDVWVVDGSIFLGHDGPEHLTNELFIDSINKHSWFHCKNINALHWFATSRKSYRFFWHQEDDYTLTSTNHIWTYPGKPTTSMSILVDNDLKYLSIYDTIYGVCSDNISKVDGE